MFKLVVSLVFGKYKVGEEISDADEMAQALRDRPNHVVAVQTPQTKAVEKAPKADVSEPGNAEAASENSISKKDFN